MDNDQTSFLFDKVIIRKVQSTDLIDLEWNGEYIHYRRLFAQAFEETKKGTAVLWMAEYKSFGLIGQLFVQLNSTNPSIADGRKRAYIHGVRVKPMYRNYGIGTMLMDTAEKDLSNRGFSEVTLNVVKTNRDALRWYKRLGYIIIGSDPGEWSYIDHLGVLRHVKEPAWKMIKLLSYPPNVIK